MGFELSTDYIDVAERIAEFRDKHPEGSLQPADLAKPFSVETIGDQTFIVYVAAAYRTPDDQRPGIGCAYEIYPGRTPYTKMSELQNAETSAWGRAIVAVLAADTKRGIASVQEMRSQSENSGVPMDPVKAARVELSAALKRVGVKPDDANARFEADGHGSLGQSTDVAAIKALTAHYLAEAGEA